MQKIGLWISNNQSADEKTNRSEISLSSYFQETQKMAKQWVCPTNAQMTLTLIDLVFVFSFELVCNKKKHLKHYKE